MVYTYGHGHRDHRYRYYRPCIATVHHRCMTNSMTTATPTYVTATPPAERQCVAAAGLGLHSMVSATQTMRRHPAGDFFAEHLSSCRFIINN